MDPADMDATRAELAEEIGHDPSDRDLAAYFMYPKVFVEFARAQETYGPTSVLPTPIYFYGIEAGDEIGVELEKGKTLVVRCLGIGDADEDGQVKVFFELNGQPRIIKVPNRSLVATTIARRKAEDGNAAHVAAPMPGVISTIAAKAGQKVEAGDVLLSIEAMKMETAIHADRNGTIAEVCVEAGAQIDAKDLLVVFEG